jgi:hypothetical protein
MEADGGPPDSEHKRRWSVLRGYTFTLVVATAPLVASYVALTRQAVIRQLYYLGLL